MSKKDKFIEDMDVVRKGSYYIDGSCTPPEPEVYVRDHKVWDIKIKGSSDIAYTRHGGTYPIPEALMPSIIDSINNPDHMDLVECFLKCYKELPYEHYLRMKNTPWDIDCVLGMREYSFVLDYYINARYWRHGPVYFENAAAYDKYVSESKGYNSENYSRPSEEDEEPKDNDFLDI